MSTRPANLGRCDRVGASGDVLGEPQEQSDHRDRAENSHRDRTGGADSQHAHAAARAELRVSLRDDVATFRANARHKQALPHER